MKSKILIFLALIVSISACKIGEDYTRKQLNLPTDFRNQKVKDSLNVSDIQWNQFFDDSTLIGLIDSALNHNIGLAIAEKNIEIAHEKLLQRKANFFPTLGLKPEIYGENHSKNRYTSANAKYYGDKTAPDFMFVSRRQHLFPFQSSWEIDVWGKLKKMKESQQATLMATKEDFKALQTSIVAEVAIAYYNLLVLDEQHKVATNNLELRRNTFELTKLQYKAGMVTSLAIQQTENQLLSASAMIPQLEREIALEENYLKSLLGQYPGKIERDKALKNIRFPSTVFTGTPMDLLRNRPDVIAAEYDLLAAYANSDVAKASRYPTLALAGTLGFDSQDLGVLFNPAGSLFSTFSGSLMQPIFQNRRLKTAYNIAEIEKQKVADVFSLTLIKAVKEVSDEINNIEKLEHEYQIAKERIANSSLAIKNSSLLFKTGLANYLEVINAQSAALTNEINLFNIRLDIITANIELYRKLGGGWRKEE